MSLILRSLLRDPHITRPLSRALRRLDNDFWSDNHWPVKRLRRDPGWDSPLSIIEDMNRQMNAAMSRMQDFTDDLDTLDSLMSRYTDDLESHSKGRNRREGQEAEVRRTESGGIQLALDVANYKPEDLKIKIVDDNLVIEGVSETSGKDSYRQTQFKRWFKLPEDCKLDEIKSKLTGDSKLVIDLPTSKPLEQRARSIPIEMDQSKQQSAEQKPIGGGGDSSSTKSAEATAS